MGAQQYFGSQTAKQPNGDQGLGRLPEKLPEQVLKDRTQSKFWTPPIFCCNKMLRKIAHSLCKTASKLCLLAEGQGAGKGEEDNTIDQQFGQSTKEPLHFRSI